MAIAYLNEEVVVKEAQRRLQASLPITWEGNRYNPMHAWTVLIGGVGMGASIAAVCREGRDAPSDTIVRETLNDQGWDDRIIEAACNDLLAQSARQCTWKGCFPVVIDLHEEPFYGKRPEDDPEVIRRGEAKAGTTYFHTFATAYVIRRNRRLTLAVTRVRAHESMFEVADRLRRRVEEVGLDVQVYLLDRQFWTYELQVAWQAIPSMMPIRRTGKKSTQGGTRPLFELQASQFVTYTMRLDHQAPLDIEVAVVVLPETKEARHKRLPKAKAAYDNVRKRVKEKARLLEEEATARNKRALTCAKKA
jgi:putative transposase